MPPPAAAAAAAAAAATPKQASPLDEDARKADVALRKKKNADAQAAFRQRRANYIATLEETVTSLEQVVLQLQDSCREAQQQAHESKQQAARLRHELRDRDRIWRSLVDARKSTHDPHDDLPLPPNLSPIQMSAPTPYAQDGLSYRPSDDPAACGAYAAADPSYQTSYAASDSSTASVAASMSRMPKYSYDYTDMHATASPTFTESPSLTSPTITSQDLSYAPRYPGDDSKAALAALDSAAPYVFSNSRSISPSSTPPSSSAALGAPYQFYPENNGISEHPDYAAYRRYNHPATATDLALHGGDPSLGGPASDALRMRFGGAAPAPTRRDSAPNGMTAPFGGSDHSSGSPRSDGEQAPNGNPRKRPASDSARQALDQVRSGQATDSARQSLSPSPGPGPMSGTLAVIKAQAFGALRRTRTRKKTSESAARVAMDVLEARGIGMGVPKGAKRQRLDEDDLDA
ncbi:hypothetical protein BD626DRAFT_566958 [Schizophyllum amplum]|uniref:BZIP domain-containing protein n=1 Tax=Schizophyllum amplum TaxID=97359 RepID=A0A550CNH8_9AGAR|nr:hypothetical protein BD626DRAFT_566958 [Auriculariopsis ampla]